GNYWPGPRDLFYSLASAIALAFLTAYPTPQSAARLGEARRAAFLRRNSYRGGKSPALLLAPLRAAPHAPLALPPPTPTPIAPPPPSPQWPPPTSSNCAACRPPSPASSTSSPHASPPAPAPASWRPRPAPALSTSPSCSPKSAPSWTGPPPPSRPPADAAPPR